MPFRKPFENSLSRSVHPCTLLDTSFCGAKTSLLFGTTPVLGSFDTLSGGTDAARIKQNQV